MAGDPILRVLDAALNRAREALRVIEDHARFVCDDRDVAWRAKRARHAVAEIARRIGADALLAARAIEQDVGREAKTPAELERGDADAVVRAALGRLSEALRSAGEFAKIAAPAAAALAEQLRYEAYALEAAVLARGPRRARFARARLYVLITELLCRGDWLATAGAALRGGAACVQLREKTLSDRELLRRAIELRVLCHAHEALLIVNDRADVARASGADGVHVGQDDLPVAEARRLVGGDRLVGVSTHDAAQFTAALAQPVDYVAFGPLFRSATKPQPHVPGLEGLRRLRPSTALPIVGIGGIDASNAAAARDAGADVLCVCGAVVGAADPEAAARGILASLE